ncbi:vesicle transport protein [Gorgonomyces haynaldii]|nr:vesicle transport protein [Gorgonomyces haynaldii]
MWLSDTQKIGVGLTGFGVFFMILGILMFFDPGFIAIGNILFLSGLCAIIGVFKTAQFFMRKEKLRGTAAFLGGIALVLVKWPMIGIIVEGFGFMNLFGDFFPVVVGFLRKLPFIGPVLSLPGIAQLVDVVAGKQLPV